MNVLFAASECTPFAKVGGLGDVIGALPKELEKQGCKVDIVLPLYEPLLNSKLNQFIVNEQDGNSFVTHFLGKDEKCKLFYLQIPNSGIRLFLIQNATYLSNGGIYLSPGAFAEGDDELRRFMFFSKAVYTLFERGVFTYDVVHSHDYHTSYLLYLFKNEKGLGVKPRLILTLHNSGNQGIIKDALLNQEINGWREPHNLLSMGVASADKIVPVSPHYAEELLAGKFCFGLENVFRAFSDRIVGIVNGLDVEMYNPQNDTFIASRYNEETFDSGKLACKKALLSELAKDRDDPSSLFIIGFVGRVVAQKNIVLISDALSIILKNEKNRSNLLFVFLGVGDAVQEKLLTDLAVTYPDNVVYSNTFDEAMAHKIFAASDLFLIPSEFEPCGLTQLIAMRYGTLPLASKVGGLVDTISEKSSHQTGFFIRELKPEFFSVQILDLFTFWKNAREDWQEMVVRSMQSDFSWQESAKKYLALYS